MDKKPEGLYARAITVMRKVLMHDLGLRSTMKSIDVTQDHCPMTFVKVKVALEQLEFGQQLDVLLSPGEPLENIPKSAREEGNRIIEIRQDNGNYHVVIEKRGYIHAGCSGHCGGHGKPA